MHIDLRQSLAWQLLPFWFAFHCSTDALGTKHVVSPAACKRSGCSVAGKTAQPGFNTHLLATPTAEKP